MLALRDELDSLKCQLEAYKNEVSLYKHGDEKERADKDKQIQMYKQTLRGMQQVARVDGQLKPCTWMGLSSN